MAAHAFGVVDNNSIAARQRELEQPVICPECQSTWFTEHIFNQYSDLAYGGGAGSDLRVINVTPQTIRVCLCGHPYTPNLSGIRGRVASGEMETFKESLKLAHNAREKAKTSAVTMDQISSGFASTKEKNELAAQIENLAGRVNEQGRELENLKFISEQQPEAVAAPEPEPTPAATQVEQPKPTEQPKPIKAVQGKPAAQKADLL